jgi:hypothetical protein
MSAACNPALCGKFAYQSAPSDITKFQQQFVFKGLKRVLMLQLDMFCAVASQMIGMLGKV